MKFKKLVVSLFASAILVSTVAISASAVSRDDSLIQPRGEIATYCSFYKQFDGTNGQGNHVSYQHSHQYTDVNLPRGTQLGLNAWKQTGSKWHPFVGWDVFYARNHYVY